MSVIAYEYNEFEGVANSLKEMPSLKETVMNNAYVKKYNSKPMPEQYKYSFEDAVDRLLWYMYVANRVAYSLQYQENTDIFTTEQKAEVYTPEQSAEKFSSFMYNIYTNSGNVFLSNEWLGLGEDIQKFLKKKFNMDYEAGGTLPTPFGQAGLVGETGAMNEMELFAMGGDLPQGVHQYFQQTNNPAFPTPHGYAKGGVVDLFEDYQSMPDNLSVIVERYQEKYEDGDMDYKETEKFLKEVEALGYTFDYGLDNEPYGLRKKGTALSELRGFEEMDSDYFAKGGRLKSALMRDRKYFNKDESWERAYSKGKNRKGYMADGGEVDSDEIIETIWESNNTGRFIETKDGLKTKDSFTSFVKKNNPTYTADAIFDSNVYNGVIAVGGSKMDREEFRDYVAKAKQKKSRRWFKKGGTVNKKNTNRGANMLLAKEIRKEGEAWKDALKRAGAMLRDK